VESKTDSNGEVGGVAFAVVGIGVNVHQREFDPGLATEATSLDLESGHAIHRQALLVALLKSLECEAVCLLDAASATALPARVEAASTWVRGRKVCVHGPQACEGMTEGLDADGFLLVRTSGGQVRVQTGGMRAAEID
jgi:BirA family biotin operon repressor/biotin-[acetyl-CoA-carboxylase] ligase